jgi:hypothetical protein
MKKEHKFYSLKKGVNKNIDGFDLDNIKDLFLRVYQNFSHNGYFDESFGFFCVDQGKVEGKVADIELEILLKIRKKGLWPVTENIKSYNEYDFFDIIEFLFFHISKPVEGTYHSYSDCGMHWDTFNKEEGQKEYISKINEILDMYKEKYILSDKGEILHKIEKGFEQIFEADIPTEKMEIKTKIQTAILLYRRYGSSLDDRINAVRNLADVLEYIRPKVKLLLTSKDENDLFNIANNFGIRHHNDKQKTDYDRSIWLSWMFYYYLSTIHVILRKMKMEIKNV